MLMRIWTAKRLFGWPADYTDRGFATFIWLIGVFVGFMIFAASFGVLVIK